MTVTALLRVGRNVRDLESAARFYAGALGFQPVGPVIEDLSLANLLGLERLRLLRMRLGAQEIELSECFPKNLVHPREMLANGLSFQHIAMITTDITGSCNQVMRLGVEAISKNGPVRLPPSSGNVTAFKFRDPDRHPLEFLQFSPGAGQAAAGIDHSAISVSDVERSVKFYAELGVTLESKQVNQGPEQDALDGLTNVTVDVIALRPVQPTPHVELLCYREPKAALRTPYLPGDICASRLIFAAPNGGLGLWRDPDGHVIVVDGRSGAR